MYILLICKQEITSLFGKPFPLEGIACTIEKELPGNINDYDVVIDFDFEEHIERKEAYTSHTKPVLIGSVLYTLQELGLYNHTIARFNHWPFFKDRSCIEFFCSPANETIFTGIFNDLHLLAYRTADVPGFVSTRIIANIIHEAYLAESEQVSSKEEIDTGMKLGTNYPYGPFEWGSKIGLQNITALLQKIALEDDRYQPSPHLLKEITAK